MPRFIYEPLGGRIVFGVGAVGQVAGELRALGAERVMLLASPSSVRIADGIAADLGGALVARWSDVRQHVPVALAEAARAAVRGGGVDAVVSIGGGSAVGLAKAIALEGDVSIVAVPTTYAGSELTPIWGLTGEHKQTGRDARVLPEVVVYDPELTLDLPPSITATSGCNAIAHCVEGFYGPGANPVTALVAREGLRVLEDALPRAVAHGRDLAARGDLLYGAFLAGSALAVAGSGIHHELCHVLGGSYAVDHGDANAVVLPHVTAWNASAVPELVGWGRALFDLTVALGAPTSLAGLGVPESTLDEIAARAIAETTANPRPLDLAGVRALLDDAFHGRRPE